MSRMAERTEAMAVWAPRIISAMERYSVAWAISSGCRGTVNTGRVAVRKCSFAMLAINEAAVLQVT